MDLNLLWFGLLGVLLTGYAILDGFDLGVGMLHLGARTDVDRRIFMNSIGPLWDGNEVWLVTFGGALFAAFPHAYATAFSAFYLPFMLLLFGLIFRAVSMEFRSKRASASWRKMWDMAFFVSSGLAALLFGVAVGDSIIGLPIGADMEFQGTFWDLLAPYSILVGAMTVSILVMHGSLYLNLKTEGELQARIRNWIWRAFFVFVILYILTSVVTFIAVPHAVRNFETYPWAWAVVAIKVLAIITIAWAIRSGRTMTAFLSSCITIASFVFLFGMSMFPNLVLSSSNPEWSLTIYNAASSQKTLSIMRTIAFIGMPFVLAYTIAIYWTFRGKVKMGKFSY